MSLIANDTVLAPVHWPRYFYNRTDARRESEAVLSRVIIRCAFTQSLSGQPETAILPFVVGNERSKARFWDRYTAARGWECFEKGNPWSECRDNL